MRKAKKMALILIVAIMFTGFGYAYWSDQLIINNTVSTGEFDVKFTTLNHSDYDNYYSSGEAFFDDESDEDYVNKKGIGTTVTRSNDGKTLTFINTNLYPGSGAWLKFRIINNGTIPARFENVSGLITLGEDLKDEFRYTIGSVKLYKIIIDKDGDDTSTLIETVHDANLNDNQFDTFDEFIVGLNNKLKYYPDGTTKIVLQPGEYIEINNDANEMRSGFDMYLREGVKEMTGTGTLTEKRTFNFSLNLKYTQHNNPID